MPLYDFRCGECGREWEELLFFSERGKVRCCGKKPVVVPSFRGKLEVVGGIFGYDMSMDDKPVRVKNRAHRKEEARKRGLVEVDNRGG